MVSLSGMSVAGYFDYAGFFIIASLKNCGLCHPDLAGGISFPSLLYLTAVFNLIAFIVYLFCSLSSSFFHRVKEPKRPAHGLSKSLPFFARATSCEHSVERRLPLVSAVPISGTKELASRTPCIVWHTRSDTSVLIPLLELTRAVTQTVPVFFLTLPFVGGLHQCRGRGLPARNRVAVSSRQSVATKL